jgi:tol-pal system protein YbgF
MEPPSSLLSLHPKGGESDEEQSLRTVPRLRAPKASSPLALAAARQSRIRARAWPACIILATYLFGAAPALAALFDDDEARKAIIDLRTRVTQGEEQNKAQLAAANEQIATLRRSLLDLNNQIEAMRAEIAKLRGSDETLARDVAELQKRQKDVGQTLDDRLRKLEPTKVVLDGQEFAVEADERRTYDEAMATLRSGEFEKAVLALTTFQRRYPASGYGPSVRFWYGNALYGKRDYKEAVAVFRAFVTAYPQHQRAPEALLALANSQAEMKDSRAARKTLDELLKAYPQSEAAVAGRERLASIK